MLRSKCFALDLTARQLTFEKFTEVPVKNDLLGALKWIHLPTRVLRFFHIIVNAKKI